MKLGLVGENLIYPRWVTPGLDSQVPFEPEVDVADGSWRVAVSTSGH